MKTICAIQVSLDDSPLGTRSRLTHSLAGTPILRRTVQQVRHVKELSDVFVLAPESQVAACRDLLAGLDVAVQSLTADPPPWSNLVRASRKWSLDGWRGGVGGSTVFDEFTDCRVLSALLEKCPADAVLSIPGAAPLFDPNLASQMIEHRRKNHDVARLTFTQALPGLAGIALDAPLIRELAASAIPISWLFSYKPDQPQKDLIFQSACLDIAAPLRFAAGRLIADTDSAMRTLTTLFAQKESWTLAEIGQFLVEHDERGIEPFPREVEIELTTDDSFPESLLSPRGSRLDRSSSMDLDFVQKIAAELLQHDDALCVLGGFGDPLLHPEFESVLEILRPRSASGTRAGVFGLCVRTSAASLTPKLCEALSAHRVDILSVPIDAWSEESFRQVKGQSSGASMQLKDISDRLEMLATMQRQRLSPTPIVVPEMTKAKENVHELYDFFDGWLRRCGAVSLTAYSHHAGQLHDRSVMDMRPPQRIPCRRLRTRCLIFSDGRVALCDQDFKGLHAVGHIGRHTTPSARDCGDASRSTTLPPSVRGDQGGSIADIWNSPALTHVRQQHLNDRPDANHLCAACTEWHRP